MSLKDIGASALSFVKHRIVGASFVSIVLLVAVILVIIYNQDKNVTAGIVGLLWVISNFEYFLITAQDKVNTRKKVNSIMMDGLAVGHDMIKKASSPVEETAILTTVAAEVAKETSLAFGSSLEDAKEESNKIVDESFSSNRDRLQNLFKPKQAQ